MLIVGGGIEVLLTPLHEASAGRFWDQIRGSDVSILALLLSVSLLFK